MPNFADNTTGREQAEALVKTRMASKTWVNGHECQSVAGNVQVRFQRFMSSANPDHGAWVESRDDAAT